MHGHMNIKKNTSVFIFRVKQFCLIRPTTLNAKGLLISIYQQTRHNILQNLSRQNYAVRTSDLPLHFH